MEALFQVLASEISDWRTTITDDVDQVSITVAYGHLVRRLRVAGLLTTDEADELANHLGYALD